MTARLLAFLAILTLAGGCAPGYYETPPPYPEPEVERTWYKNPETEQEYRQRIWWENYDSERARFHHRWR